MRIPGKQPSDNWDGRGANFLEIGYGKSAYMSGNFLGAEDAIGLMPSWRW
jgi:hypothetical protein